MNRMQTDNKRVELATDEITESIIGGAFRVQNGLGCGFMEKVYENALTHELLKTNHRVNTQHSIDIEYDGVNVGHYVADLLVDGQVLVELKAIQALDSTYYAQCLNYLAATKLDVCLLLNFGKPKLEFKRILRPSV